jgi:hypothetical protein
MIRSLRFSRLPEHALGVACAIALVFGTMPSGITAQAPAGDWSVEAEVGGSVFFGNRPQTQFTAKSEIERSDPLFESNTQFQFTYGVSENNDGVVTVSRRSWTALSSLDFRPEDRWRPFVSGRMESSFERRIALRYDAGAGVKLDSQTDRNNRTEFSLSLLAERTYGRTEGTVSSEDGSLARWSSNLRIRRTLWGDRVSVDLRNGYRPVFDAFGNFTLSNQGTFSLGLTEVVALRLTLRTDYDSGAVDRGASTNHDGRVQISIVAQF